MEYEDLALLPMFIVAGIFIGSILVAPFCAWHQISMDRRNMAIIEKCADQYPDRIESMIDKFIKG